jgi:hypothetical protein
MVANAGGRVVLKLHVGKSVIVHDAAYEMAAAGDRYLVARLEIMSETTNKISKQLGVLQ